MRFYFGIVMKTTYQHKQVGSDPITKTKNCTGNGSGVRRRFVAPLLGTILGLLTLSAAQANPGYELGVATNYQILYSGLGLKLDFQGGQGAGSRCLGNIGIGGDATLYLNPNSLVSNSLIPPFNGGAIDFANSVNINGPTNGVKGPITGGISQVITALTYVNDLSKTLGEETGNALKIDLVAGQTQVVDAADGKLDADGNRIFTIEKASDFKFNFGSNLIFQGNTPLDHVVINFKEGGIYQFNGNITFRQGTDNEKELESDQLLWNFYTDPTAKKTKDVSIQNNSFTPSLVANPLEGAQGVFLDPDGVMSMNNSTLCGRFFGGNGQNGNVYANMDINESAVEQCAVAPEPSTYLLLGVGALLLGVIYRRTA